MKIPVGTKVLVKKKTTGCPPEHVFGRGSTARCKYPLSFPFHAWVGKSTSTSREPSTYVLSYREDLESGDFYRREDFEPLDFHDDKEFEKLFDI